MKKSKNNEKLNDFMTNMFLYYGISDIAGFSLYKEIEKSKNYSILNDIFKLENISLNNFLIYENDQKKYFNINWELLKEAKDNLNANIAFLSNFDKQFNFYNKVQMKSDKGQSCLQILKKYKDVFYEIFVLKKETVNINNEIKLLIEFCWDNIKIDPSRQSANFQLTWKKFHDIEKMPGELLSLPNSGPDSLLQNKDGIIEAGDKNKKGKKGLNNSIDLKYIYNNNVYYISHKYNNNTGGGQNQTKEHSFEQLKNFKGKNNEFSVCIFEGFYQKSFDEESKNLKENQLFFNKISDFYKHILQ